jgi:hypothetical protein
MSEGAPGGYADELAPRLESAGMSARDVRAILHDPEFQAIGDRNSKFIVLQKYVIDEGNISMNNKKLVTIYQISKGRVRRIRCVARKKHLNQPIDRPHKLTDDQEREVIEMLLTTVNEPNFPNKREVLNEIENRYHKVLTYGWIREFLRHHQDAIAYVTVRSQEDPRLQIPPQFLEQYLAFVQEHAVGYVVVPACSNTF